MTKKKEEEPEEQPVFWSFHPEKDRFRADVIDIRDISRLILDNKATSAALAEFIITSPDSYDNDPQNSVCYDAL